MLLDDLVNLLQEYKKSFPHRGIQIQGEVNVLVPLDDGKQSFKVDLGPVDETQGR